MIHHRCNLTVHDTAMQTGLLRREGVAGTWEAATTGEGEKAGNIDPAGVERPGAGGDMWC